MGKGEPFEKGSPSPIPLSPQKLGVVWCENNYKKPSPSGRRWREATDEGLKQTFK